MTEREYLQEQVNSNAECLRRMMGLISGALPHVEREVVDIHKEWVRVSGEIEKDYRKE